MPIRRKLIVLIMSLSALVTGLAGIKIWSLASALTEERRVLKTTDILNYVGLALVDLSLERSIIQVASNLPDPISQAFRDKLAGQRKKVDTSFNAAFRLMDEADNLIGIDGYRQALQADLAILAQMRIDADKAVDLPLNARDPAFLAAWPQRLPNLAEGIERRRILILSQSARIPTTPSVFFEVQHHAWRMREFAGRARTLMAIGIALGRPLNQEEMGRIETLHGTVNRSWDMLRMYASELALPAAILKEMAIIEKGFAGDYEALRRTLTESSAQGQPPAIGFNDFFSRSSAHLEETERLFAAAQAEMRAYFDQAIASDRLALIGYATLIAIAISVSFYLAFFVNRNITSPLRRIQNAIGLLARKDYAVELMDQKRVDEMGDLARSVAFFKERLQEGDVLRLEQERLKRQSELDRKQVFAHVADQFDREVGSLLRALQDSAATMTDAADGMRGVSGETLEIAHVTSNTADRTETDLQSVVTAAHDLSASIDKIAEQVDSAAHKADLASAQAERTRAAVDELNGMAASIESVIDAIRAIADKTNLLALNATIEAARAGEAGKGFAVVASEVKQLANQTAMRTKGIADQVQSIQAAISANAQAMQGIIDNVKEIDGATGLIAQAIERQSIATSAINESVIAAAQGSRAVNNAIAQVRDRAEVSQTSSSSVLSAANHVRDHSAAILEKVSHLIAALRAA
jgi:methyl-accepting chemotaxis protein